MLHNNRSNHSVPVRIFHKLKLIITHTFVHDMIPGHPLLVVDCPALRGNSRHSGSGWIVHLNPLMRVQICGSCEKMWILSIIFFNKVFILLSSYYYFSYLSGSKHPLRPYRRVFRVLARFFQHIMNWQLIDRQWQSRCTLFQIHSFYQYLS